MFKVFVVEIENQYDKRNKRLRSDKGYVYDLVAFNEFYSSKGIINEKTAPYSTKMNEKAKRKDKITGYVINICLFEPPPSTIKSPFCLAFAIK